MAEADHHIEIQVDTRYLEARSDPDQDRYAFAYTVTLTNRGRQGARLLSRHWVIRDAHNRAREVFGEGVVGETPYLAPGKSYRYSSGAVLETELGTMEGEYQMVADDGEPFEAEIPRFTLSIPRTLH